MPVAHMKTLEDFNELFITAFCKGHSPLQGLDYLVEANILFSVNKFKINIFDRVLLLLLSFERFDRPL